MEIITTPPISVSILGCSLITNHTQIGPNIVSSKKNKFTSAAIIYLGAKVIKTNGIATQNIHIAGIIKKSFPLIFRSSTKNSAIKAIKSLAVIAEGIKLAIEIQKTMQEADND